MFLKVLFQVIAVSVPFLAISDNVPNWLNVLAWLYLFGVMMLGVFILNLDKVDVWIKKQEKYLKQRIKERKDAEKRD